MTTTFLTPKEVGELTGIHQGRDGRTAWQRQVGALKAMKIPHYVNPAGRPVVVRAVIEGGRHAEPMATSWQPSLA